MDRIWQWAWDRYGARYSWAVCSIAFFVVLPVYLLVSFVLVAFEKSDHYLQAAAVTIVLVAVQANMLFPPGVGGIRLAEQWAAGRKVDRAKVLEETYAYARGAMLRGVAGTVVVSGGLWALVGAVAGATNSRLIQYGILGAVLGNAVLLIAVHSLVESAFRPVRSPWPVTRGSVIPCRALTRRLPRGRTFR